MKKGQKVVVHYHCALDNGTLIEGDGQEGKHYEFIFGSKGILPGFAKTVDEMQVGEKRTVRIPFTEAYGAYDESLIETVPVADIPNANELPVGQHIVISTSKGQMRVKVSKIEDGLVYFDHNHELAGKDLNYTIKLVDLPGISGSIIENEKYKTGSCSCAGCDALREALHE